MGFRYEDLEVGTEVLNFIDSVYATTASFPSEEKFALTNQVRRAAQSIYLNLAEGSARRSKKEFMRFITIAMASLVESHAGFRIALRLEYIQQDAWSRIDSRSNYLWMRLATLRSSQIE